MNFMDNSNHILKLQNKLVDTLSQLTCVRRIVSFGATASGTHDQWSDVDLLVVCRHCDATQWLCASMIREEFPVLYYRPFTAREQPCGRYWFVDASPMNRLDISFETEEGFETIRANPSHADFTLTLRDEYIATGAVRIEEDEALASPGHPIVIPQEEIELGRLVYCALEAIKYDLRGNTNWKWDRETCLNELHTALQASSCYTFAGGDLRKLAARCFELNDF